eukprot:jgi/Mesen1/11045/ME000099S10485
MAATLAANTLCSQLLTAGSCSEAGVGRRGAQLTSSSGLHSAGFRKVALTAHKVSVRSHSRPLSVRADVQFLTADDAKKVVEKDGYKVLDVRDEKQYARSHIPGSINVPLYTENKDNDIETIIKRQAHNNFAGMLYGLTFTKPNDNFVSQVEKTVNKDQKLLVVCQEGLRSSSATTKLQQAGYNDLAMITAGLNVVPPGTFPKEGSVELNKAGKGGFVAIQTQFSIVLGSILIGAIIFIQLFPDQASVFLK